MKTTMMAIAAALLTVCAQSSQAQDANQAARNKIAMCIGCHGIPGYRTAFPEVYSVPKIGGQNKAYLVSALQAYKKGDRLHATMRGIAASLTDKDMEEIASYYASK